MKHCVGMAVPGVIACAVSILPGVAMGCSPVDLKQMMVDATSNAYRLWMFTALASSSIAALYLCFLPRKWGVPAFVIAITLLHPAWTMADANFPAINCSTPVEDFALLALALVLVVGIAGLAHGFVRQRREGVAT